MGADLRARLHGAIDDLLDEVERLRVPLADEYTSEMPPVLTSRRAFNEACRSGRILGARKEGKRWFCPRAAWHASRARKPTFPSRVTPVNDVETAEAMIAAAGFRLSSRGAS